MSARLTHVSESRRTCIKNIENSGSNNTKSNGNSSSSSNHTLLVSIDRTRTLSLPTANFP